MSPVTAAEIRSEVIVSKLVHTNVRGKEKMSIKDVLILH